MKSFILLIVIAVTIAECATIKDQLLRSKAIESASKFWKIPDHVSFKYAVDLSKDKSTKMSEIYTETETSEVSTIYTTPTTEEPSTAITTPTTEEPSTPITTEEPSTPITTEEPPTTEEPETTEEPPTTAPPPFPKKPFIKVIFDYLLKVRFEFEVNRNR